MKVSRKKNLITADTKICKLCSLVAIYHLYKYRKKLVAQRFQDLIDQKKQKVWIFFIFGLLDQFSSIRDTKLTNSTFFKEVIKLS